MADFTCAEATVRTLVDRQRIDRSAHRKRQPRLGARPERRSESGERIDDPAHGPRAQRRVSGKEGRERMACDETDEQPRTGAGIAHVEDPVRLGQATDTTAANPPDVAVAVDVCAPSARKALAVASTSPASSRPVTFVSPTALAARISARWEMDLSPGASTHPANAIPGPVRRRFCLERPAVGARRWRPRLGDEVGEWSVRSSISFDTPKANVAIGSSSTTPQVLENRGWRSQNGGRSEPVRRARRSSTTSARRPSSVRSASRPSIRRSFPSRGAAARRRARRSLRRRRGGRRRSRMTRRIAAKKRSRQPTSTEIDESADDDDSDTRGRRSDRGHLRSWRG